MEKALKDLRRENQLLRSLVVDLSTLLKELLEVMPSGIREQENVQRMLELSEKLIHYGIDYGSPLPASDHSE